MLVTERKMIQVFNRYSTLIVLEEKCLELGFIIGEVGMKRRSKGFNVG